MKDIGELDPNKLISKIPYIEFWLWFLFVSVVFSGVYYYIFDLGNMIGSSLSVSNKVLDKLSESPLNLPLKIIAGLLLWWRAVKVIVLLGSPFPVGLTLNQGREIDGNSGRPVHLSWIGDFDRENLLWFGSVLRAHPNSDKLVRTRLEFLIALLPMKVALVIQESRLIFRLGYDCTKVYKHYSSAAENYMKQSNSDPYGYGA